MSETAKGTATPQAPGEGYDFGREFDARKKLYIWLCATFLTSLIIANLIGAYLFSISLPFALPFVGSIALLSAGIIPFPITFILTDLINEFYGKKGAQFITFVGFAMSILVYTFLSIGETLPVDARTALTPEQYFAFSQNYSGMFIASLTAYLVGQLLDIQVFQMFKGVFHNKHLWIRATGSTVVSQVFDSILVTSIFFYGKMPAADIAQLAASNYVLKFIVAVAITPVLYVGQAAIRRVLARHTQTAHSA